AGVFATLPLLGALGVAWWVMASTHVKAAPAASQEDVAALIREASSAPPEFAADLLMRLAVAPILTDAARRRELLETAFIRAYGAQESHKWTAPFAAPDSRTGAASRAYATGLDMLTLQL